MSSASSAVTYTSVYTDSEPGRAFWGADDEEISEGGIPRVVTTAVTVSAAGYNCCRLQLPEGVSVNGIKMKMYLSRLLRDKTPGCKKGGQWAYMYIHQISFFVLLIYRSTSRHSSTPLDVSVLLQIWTSLIGSGQENRLAYWGPNIGRPIKAQSRILEDEGKLLNSNLK
ncbi:hypothetical protein Tco_1541691 [Tanacetum coccineum]